MKKTPVLRQAVEQRLGRASRGDGRLVLQVDDLVVVARLGKHHVVVVQAVQAVARLDGNRCAAFFLDGGQDASEHGRELLHRVGFDQVAIGMQSEGLVGVVGGCGEKDDMDVVAVVAELLDGLGAEQAGHVDIAQDEVEDLAPVDFRQHIGGVGERVDTHVFHMLALHEFARELFGAEAVALVVVADGNFDHPSSFHETPFLPHHLANYTIVVFPTGRGAALERAPEP